MLAARLGSFCKAIENESEYFIFKVKTDNAGESSSNQFKLPLIASGTYNFDLLCVEDPTANVHISSWNQSETTLNFLTSGTYTIKIKPTCYGWLFNFGGDRQKIIEIQQWGRFRLGDVTDGGYFRGCINLIITATDILDLTGTTDLSNCFGAAISLTGIPNVNLWNFSNVTSMVSTWFFAQLFASDLGSINTSSVKYMINMLRDVTSFDHSLGNLNISSLELANNLLTGGSLSTVNYDDTLNKWAAQAPNIKNNVNISFGSSKYSSASVASRLILTGTYGWNIIDGGLV